MEPYEALTLTPSATSQVTRWLIRLERKISSRAASSIEPYSDFTIVHYGPADLVYDDLGLCGAVSWLKRREVRNCVTPSSGFLVRARRHGIAQHLYQKKLRAGLILVSDTTQSIAANSLWKKLGQKYPWTLIKLVEDRAVEVDTSRASEPDVRIAMALSRSQIKRLVS